MLNKSNLHQYQIRAVNALIKNPRYYLALGIGLGKTVTTLTAVTQMKLKNVWIIAPKRVAQNVWEKEALLWEHTKHLTFSNLVGHSPAKRKQMLTEDTDIKIINIELWTWLLEQYPKKKLPCSMLVFDESHAMKDPSSKRFKKTKTFVKHFPRVVLLSATPASNSLLNLWSQIYLLDCGQRLFPSMSKYKNEFFDSDFMGYTFTIKQGAEEAIYDKISDVMLSMSAEDYLELPELTIIDVNITLDKDSLDKYNTLKRDAILEFKEINKEVTAVNAGVLLTKLIHYSTGCCYVEDTKETVVVHNCKIDVLKSMVDDTQGEPVIVLYKFKSDVVRIKEVIKGVSELKDADDIVDRWNNKEIPVLLLNPQAASCGLNLQHGGHNIIEFAPTFSYQDTHQVYGRLFRQGQKNNVIVRRLLCEDTVDYHVVQALANKKQSQDRLLEAVKLEIESVK